MRRTVFQNDTLLLPPNDDKLRVEFFQRGELVLDGFVTKVDSEHDSYRILVRLEFETDHTIWRCLGLFEDLRACVVNVFSEIDGERVHLLCNEIARPVRHREYLGTRLKTSCRVLLHITLER